MPEQSNLLMYGVAVVAFVAGYALVSFIIKHMKALKGRPPLNEELWRQQEEARKIRAAEAQKIEDDHGTGQHSNGSVPPTDEISGDD